MKKITFKAILLVAVVLCGMTNTMKAATITVSSDAVVAGSNYNTIQAAYDYVKALPALTEKYVIEIQGSYDPTSGVTLETFPINFTANTASAEFDITIKPAAGVKKTLAAPNKTVIASGMTFATNATTLDLTGKITFGDISMISSASYIAGMGTYASASAFSKVTSVSGNVLTVPGTNCLTAGKTNVNLYFGAAQTKTLYFNAAKYITIDGVSRTGTTGLTIENPNCIYANAIYIASNSMYNTIKNCVIRGANQTGAWQNGYQGTIYFYGGQYNTIDNNDVCDMNNALIPYPICAFQMTAAGGTNNNNTISNNNIYNISNQYSGNGTCTFIQFGSDGTSTNNTITGNRLYWTAPTTFSSNAITFFAFGTIGLGNKVEGNVIGYADANASVKQTLTFTGTGGTIYAMNGIKNSTCKNNIIGGVDITGNSFVGIGLSPHTAGSLTAADDICSGNQIKDITVNANSNNTLYGIFFGTAPTNNVNVNNSIIKNLSNSSATGTITNTIYGINHNFAGNTIALTITTVSGSTAATITSSIGLASGVTYTLSGNANIPASTTFAYTGSTSITLSAAATAAGTGTATTATMPMAFNINCINNEVSNLTAGGSNSTVANNVVAFLSGGCSNIFEKNLIYNLKVQGDGTGTSTNSVIKAMRFATSKSSGITIKNNIFRLGTDVTLDAEISAIINEGLSGAAHPFNIYHNSIYIGGTSQTKPSHCLSRAGSVSGAISIQNNIFSNVRTGGAAVNQVYNLYAATDITTSQNNLYQYGSLFGTVTTTLPATFTALSDWNSARVLASLSEDTNSKDQLAPLFTGATGTSAPDMHVPANSPANESGLVIATVTDDFTGLTRADYVTATTTNADMGAYVISNSTSVESVKQPSDLSVYGAQNNIMFNNLSGNTANVFTLGGQLVKTSALTSDKVAVPVSKGFYIVKVGDKVTKVSVK